MSRGSSFGGRWILAALVTLLLAVGVPQPSFAGDRKPAVKQRLAGVLDREGPPPEGLSRVMNVYALHLLWKDLQPRAGPTADQRKPSTAP